MREIKFRAWLKNAKTMGYPKKQWHMLMWAEDEHQPIEIMQYTGLLDKNGVEIYEGDIVTTESISLEKRLVKSVEFGTVCDAACNHQGYGLRGFSVIDHSPDSSLHRILGWDIEVIGNIYESPELLEAK